MKLRGLVLAVFASILIVGALGSEASAHPATPATRHAAVIDSTNYQSTVQLLTNTQVMVVATVESVTVDRSAPASQPASDVTLKVKDVVRGHPGKQIIVWQPRGGGTQIPQLLRTSLKEGRTYLLCLAAIEGTRSFFVVGGKAGEFAYSEATRKFTTLDPTASWEQGNFTLSLAKTGASLYPAGGPPQPSWLNNSSGAAVSAGISWSSMTNDLGLSLSDVSCPSVSLCVFAGDVSSAAPSEQVPAVAVSTGPFSPHATIVGTTTTFPPNASFTPPSVSCPGSGLCVLSTVDGIYTSTDPTSAHWTLQVAPLSDDPFEQVSCPTVSFCAVAAGERVLVSASPMGGSSGWHVIHVASVGFESISCPTSTFCVGGGGTNATVGGSIASSTDPLVPATWSGGATTHPEFAQHSGQYSVIGISCPTSAFCIADTLGGAPLVSTDPAGGLRTWTEAANGNGYPGFATCTALGQCSVTGVGDFQARGGAGGPGTVGYPVPGVSCVSTSFCITTDDELLAVGKATQ